MSEKDLKIFQSGREVFEKYIPGYMPQHQSSKSERQSIEYRNTPKDVAEDILSPFKEAMTKIFQAGTIS